MSVAGEPAAVGRQADAVYVFCLVGAQIDHRPGGVLGHTQLGERGDGLEPAGYARVFIQIGGLRRPHEVGREAVEAYAGLRAHGLDHVLGGVLDGGLGDGIALEAGAVPGERGGGGEVQEVAADLVVDHILEQSGVFVLGTGAALVMQKLFRPLMISL